MVVIRLSRGGAKRRPFYTIVVSDRREARDGRCIERIGYFNPIAAGKEIRLHLESERAQYWISQGAQPSERVQKLMKEHAKSTTTAA
jgi:small subunit ribosomal protein S16